MSVEGTNRKPAAGGKAKFWEQLVSQYASQSPIIVVSSSTVVGILLAPVDCPVKILKPRISANLPDPL